MEIDLSMDMVKVEGFYNLLQDFGLEPPCDDFQDLTEEDLQILWKILIKIKLL